ncbi:MAG: hypothetical protein K6E73_05640 [Bacteroidales bacterium]|nr:hypothetical protein [Bacteroidales bacterium]
MKNLSKSVRAVALAMTFPFLFDSCATITSGGINPSITLNSPVTDPVTITTDYDTYSQVYFPVTVQVKRHRLNGKHIQISSLRYDFDDVVLKAQLNGWVFGNIILGGLIGAGVDCATGCVMKPLQNEFRVYPAQKKDVVADSTNVQKVESLRQRNEELQNKIDSLREQRARADRQ